LHARAAARALAAMHVNCGMGMVCAAPTAGSAGVLPGVLTTFLAERGVEPARIARALLAAGAVGLIVAQRATFAAEVAGCQVEIGAAGAMAAAAVVDIAGGTARQAADAAAISFQNTMGSVCDLVQGIVEIPCHTRNAAAASAAIVCADLILGGYENPIPLDETIDAVYAVGKAMPAELRVTSLGGLAVCPSACGLKRIRQERAMRRIAVLGVLIVAAWASLPARAAQPRGKDLAAPDKAGKTAPALDQAPVNFSDPPREYETVQLGPWKALVEKQLLAEQPALAKRALAKLERQLGELFAVLPRQSHEDLRKLTLLLMYGVAAKGGGRNNGLEYFQKDAPKHREHLDPRMASAILIYSAENYDWLPAERALKALAHEFGHAYHLEHWPELRADIHDAWENAVKAGLYRNVKDRNGKVVKEGYAIRNHLEYFAELTAVYFVGGYYYPFTREELRKYDPHGYALIERLWDVRR
jgi:hypothetical protein